MEREGKKLNTDSERAKQRALKSDLPCAVRKLGIARALYAVLDMCEPGEGLSQKDAYGLASVLIGRGKIRGMAAEITSQELVELARETHHSEGGAS